MLPKISRSEKWSVGTKVYQDSRSGERKLLVTILQENEGETIKLFK